MVCAIYQDTQHGQEIMAAVQDQSAAMNLTLKETSAHHPTKTAITAALLRLRGAGCDLVLMGTVPRDTILVLDMACKMAGDNTVWVADKAPDALSQRQHRRRVKLEQSIIC